MHFITRFWVTFVLKNKQFIRFHQSLGLAQNQSYSTSEPLTVMALRETKVYDKLGPNPSFSTFACSKSVMNHSLVSRSRWDIQSPLRNTLSTGLLTDTLNSVNDSSVVNPGLIQLDNLLYPYNAEVDPTRDYLPNFVNTGDTLFYLILQKNLVLYKVITLLSLLNSLDN